MVSTRPRPIAMLEISRTITTVTDNIPTPKTGSGNPSSAEATIGMDKTDTAPLLNKADLP